MKREVETEFTNLYLVTMEEVARRIRRTSVLVVILLGTLAAIPIIALFTKSLGVSVAMIVGLFVIDCVILVFVVKLSVRGYTEDTTGDDRTIASIQLTEACVGKKRLVSLFITNLGLNAVSALFQRKSAMPYSFAMVNGELRPGLYRVLLQHISNCITAEGGRPPVEFIYGPKLQAEIDGREFMPPEEFGIEDLRQTNPELARAVETHVVELWRLPSRAPFHIALIADCDLYIEELHASGEARGAYLLKNATKLVSEWKKYVAAIKSRSPDSQSIHEIRNHAKSAAIRGRDAQSLIGVAIFVACLLGLFVSSFFIQSPIVRWIICLAWALLAFEAYILGWNSRKGVKLNRK